MKTPGPGSQTGFVTDLERPLCKAVQSLSHARLFATPCPAARQAPLSTGFPRQEYWSGVPCPPPGDSPDLEIEPKSPAAPVLQVDSLPLSHRESPKLYIYKYIIVFIWGSLVAQ